MNKKRQRLDNITPSTLYQCLISSNFCNSELNVKLLLAVACFARLDAVHGWGTLSLSCLPWFSLEAWPHFLYRPDACHHEGPKDSLFCAPCHLIKRIKRHPPLGLHTPTPLVYCQAQPLTTPSSSQVLRAGRDPHASACFLCSCLAWSKGMEGVGVRVCERES